MKTLGAALILATIVSFAACGDGSSTPQTGGPVLGTQQCDPMSDLCVHSHTELFAISHAFVDPDNTVYYRVTVPAWRTGSDWGDGTNGFFYRATVTGNGTKTATYVPFNGVSIGADERPMMPQFTFIVEADVSMGEANTTLAIDACATNYTGGTVTECSMTLWTDTYSGLPVPAVGFGPAEDPFNVLQGPNVLFDAETGSAAEIPNNGVYPVPLLICPTVPGSSSCATESAYTAEQLQWFYDHLIFFDLAAKPYTNDLFTDSAQHRSIGVLTIDEAAYPISETQYRTRYGSTSAFGAEAAPEKQFFFYTRNGSRTAITVGVQLLYDGEDCNGNLNQVGCGSPNVTGAVTITPAAAISPLSEQPGGVTAFLANQNLTAGTVETRTINFQKTNESALCTNAVNPLAVNAGGRPVNLPNYVIEETLGDGNWAASFPPALYYVLPAGFGNCGATNPPFCDRTANYIGYVPHYTDTNGGGGVLNGGSTDEALVESFTLADQYEVGDVSGSGVNRLVWFDNCGFGYTYEECTTASGVSCSVTLTARTHLSTVSLPSGRKELTYAVTNQLPQAVVFGKECCASFFQENDQTGVYEPPQQINDGFGVFVGASTTTGFTYNTIFENELMAVYVAATGNRLFKTELGGSEPLLYRCTDSGATIELDQSSNPRRLALGGDGPNAVGCGPFPECPLGMTSGTDGDYLTCTAEKSNFIMGIEDWRDERLFGVSSVQLRAWGGEGTNGSSDTDIVAGAAGGEGGFALTVKRPNELPDALYAYTGENRGSTLVSSGALLSLSIDFGEMPPDPGPILLIAGGGGGGGSASGTCGVNPTAGAAGADAIANASGIPGPFVSEPGGNAATVSRNGASGGQGGNQDSEGSGGSGGDDGSNKGGSGGDGIGDGNWNTDGSLIIPASWDNGQGGGKYKNKTNVGFGGDGAGGFGGGGGGSDVVCGSGGGGGGSWASGNTVHDAGAPASKPASPARVGVFQLAYLPGSEVCTLITSPRKAVRCTVAASEVPLDLDSIVDEATLLAGLESLSFDDVPVSIEAWGGRGGKGGDALAVYPENAVYADGGDHGGSGYARSTLTLSDLQNDFSASPYVYVGMQGRDGPGNTRQGDRAVGSPGYGGAATLVLSAPLSSATQLGDVLLIAGGGGGGGQANAGHIPYDGRDGGQGGSAVATVDADASGAGKPRGQGGADGVGACTVGDIGSRCGDDGIGGMGGGGANPPQESAAGWVGLSLKIGNGHGGLSRGGDDDGGAGGGGFGGGETGDAADGIPDAGGGGGGSWARRSTIDDTDLPYLGADNPPTTDSGAVVMTFDVCAVYPDLFGCD